MGSLVYGGSDVYELDDRLLSHAKIAITAKLRRNESFLINWTIPSTSGSGRVSLWLSAAIPLEYRFSGSKPPELNRAWIEALERSSAGTRGMVLMGESEAVQYLRAAGSVSAP